MRPERGNKRVTASTAFRFRFLLPLLAILAPILFVLGLGIHAWYGLEDRWLWLIGVSVFSVLAVLGYRYLNRRNPYSHTDLATEFKPNGQRAWGPQEEEIWSEVKREVVRKIKTSPSWADVLQSHPLWIADFVSTKYGAKSKLDINPLEALTLLEEVSRRYRRRLHNEFPLIESLTLRRAEWLYRTHESEEFQAFKKYAPGVLHLYQSLTNPGGKAFELLFGDVKGEVFDETVEAFKVRMQQWFLLECTEVLMDLYSGRFSVATDSLPESAQFSDDTADLHDAVEPLRIVVIGQVSSGKSTLINRLCDDCVAEVDLLPTTDRRTVHELSLSSGISVRLCDLPGLDNKLSTSEMQFDEVISADLVLWCLKATQSAKALDQALSIRIDSFYQDKRNISRKPPKRLGVLTHADVLGANQAPNDTSEILDAAASFNAELVTLDAILPLGIHDDKGLADITNLIEIYLEDSYQVQLNRRRSNAGGTSLNRQISRVGKGTRGLFRLFKSRD